MLEKKLYECLKTIDGGIFALLAPQNKQLPYSTYNIISDIKTTALAGQCYLPQTRFQINVFDTDLAKVMLIRDDVEQKLLASSDFKCIIYQTFANVTDEGRVFHFIIDFKLW